ncbi:hypothetical protein Daus18300_009348 [Diaporthe australafricana]|uniref:Uncharacterized protein n=1 Tax=Diaporthe australafricana TaxID=127596 RepID=A0ABR3WEP0_9PEZI
MYVPLGVQAQFWFAPRLETDNRSGPSPSVQALKLVRETNKKHLRFLAQHEQKLLQHIDPDDANDVYAQYGMKRPEPGDDPCPDSSNKDDEPYRRGDLEPITVVGLRSHHHPVPEVRAQAFATWKEMKAHYYDNQPQAATQATSSWVVQTDDAFSEAGTWTTQEASTSDWQTDWSAPDSCSASEWGDDDLHRAWSDSEDDAESSDGNQFGQVPALPGSEDWPAELPTPPVSEICSPPSSPVLSDGQPTPAIFVSDPDPSTNSLASKGLRLSAREELAQVLNDRRIMETCLDVIVKRIKNSSMTKADKEKEKAAQRYNYQPSHWRRKMLRVEERGDSKRSLCLYHKLIMSSEQAKLHNLEETCRASFKNHFQMTHVYEDAVGKVHTEPVATEGLPPGNQYEWMKAHWSPKPHF